LLTFFNQSLFVIVKTRFLCNLLHKYLCDLCSCGDAIVFACWFKLSVGFNFNVFYQIVTVIAGFRVKTTQEKPLGCTNNITDVDDTGRYWGFIQR
jgi:hypothetical protein